MSGHYKKKYVNDGEELVAQLCIHGNITDKGGSGGMPGLSKGGNVNLHVLRPVIDKAFELPGISAVVLSINCSSGSPSQCSILSKYLRRAADTSGVPLLALVEDSAVCGGYWLACACDVIFADQNSMIGSVGSITFNCNLNKLLSEYDVESRILATHPNKVGPNPMAPLDGAFQAQERIQLENMKVVHRNFVRWVSERRGKRMRESDKEDVFDGRVFVGANALRKGLVDYIGGKEEIDHWLGKKYGAMDPRWVNVESAEAAMSMGSLIPGLI